MQLLPVGEVVVDVVGLPLAELLDLFQGERLIERHGDVPDVPREDLYKGITG